MDRILKLFRVFPATSRSNTVRTSPRSALVNVKRHALSYRVIAAAVLAAVALSFGSSAALLAQDPAPLAAAILDFQDVEDGGPLSIEGLAMAREEHFVCMSEFDDSLPPCEANADGTLSCWGSVLHVSAELALCLVGFAIPMLKAVKAAEKAWDAILAAKAAMAGASAAVSAAWSAIAAILKDIVCGALMPAIRELVDCIYASS